MIAHLNITGFLLIALAFVHAIFPRYFKWKTEMVSLSLINRQMMYIHTLFIALVLLLMGLLCLISSRDLLETQLGGRISLGFSIFWTVRLFVQFFGYSPLLWKGKPFETFIHIVFTLFWAYLGVLFFLIYWQNDTVKSVSIAS